MEKMDQLLARWRSVAPVVVPVGSLKTDPALQPRSADCITLGLESSEKKRSEDHVHVIASRIAEQGVDVEPILAVETPDGLHVVDGHHRLLATRAAGRRDVPVRILVLDWSEAVMASKFVNFGAEKMGMHPDQRRDAAWQWIAGETGRGVHPLPRGVSQHAIAKRFAISVGNVNTMMARLRELAIDPAGYKSDHLDPGTRWPRWRYARNRAYGRDWTPPPLDEQVDREGLKLALKIAEARERFGSEVLRSASQHLRDRGDDFASLQDALEYLIELDEPDTDF